MGFLDIVIIIVLISGGFAGAKNGFFRQTVVLIGTIICFILAWLFKNPIANFLSFNLPFFEFNGLKALNIVFYQLAAFLLLLILFTAVLVVLVKITGIFENILKATIILSIPSKIIGFFIGLIEEYIWVFIALVVLSLPAINFKMIKDSNLANFILNNSPVLTKASEKTLNVYNGIYEIIKSDGEISNAEVNKRSLILMLDNKMITVESIDILIEKNKVELKETQFLDKYREED